MSDSGKWSSYPDLLTSADGRFQTIGIVMASLVFSAWLMGAQVLFAGWGIIDDHDTLTMMGAGHHHLPLNEYFSAMLTRTELGSIGHAVRFRPFYYPAMLGEAVVWGDNVHLWYATRLVLFAVFIAGIWIVVARYLGLIVGLSVVLVVSRMPFWSDVWARLGPGEIYASAGFGLWIFGIERLFAASGEKLRNLGLLAMTCGTIMMVGSKETLFPFVGYTLCAFAFFIHSHRTSIAGWIHLVVMLAYGGCTAVVIGLALSRAGQDFLGRSVGLTERLTQILPPLGSSGVRFLLPATVLLGATAGVVRFYTPDPRLFRDLWLRPALIYLIGVLLVWSLYLSQYVAYNGQWPTGYRYDFPGLLALPALIVISIMFVTAIVRQYPPLNLVVRVGVLAAAVVMIVLSVRHTFPLSAAAADNIRNTRKFQAELSELASLAKQDPQRPIILRANGAWSYERIVSVEVYLRLHYDVSNQIAVKFYPDNELKYRGLASAIKQWELEGRPQHFVPLAAVAERAKAGCLSLGFDGPAEPGCLGGFLL